MFWFCGPGAPGGQRHRSRLPKNIWYKFGLFHNALATKIPQSFLAITLISNFGTFLLYMMSCLIAIVAFHEHHMHGFIKHKVIPLFGLLANLVCMIFYLVGPFFVAGHELEGAVCRTWRRRRVGHLRDHLLPGPQQEAWEGDHPFQADGDGQCDVGQVLIDAAFNQTVTHSGGRLCFIVYQMLSSSHGLCTVLHL